MCVESKLWTQYQDWPIKRCMFSLYYLIVSFVFLFPPILLLRYILLTRISTKELQRAKEPLVERIDLNQATKIKITREIIHPTIMMPRPSTRETPLLRENRKPIPLHMQNGNTDRILQPKWQLSLMSALKPTLPPCREIFPELDPTPYDPKRGDHPWRKGTWLNINNQSTNKKANKKRQLRSWTNTWQDHQGTHTTPPQLRIQYQPPTYAEKNTRRNEENKRNHQTKLSQSHVPPTHWRQSQTTKSNLKPQSPP